MTIQASIRFFALCSETMKIRPEGYSYAVQKSCNYKNNSERKKGREFDRLGIVEDELSLRKVYESILFNNDILEELIIHNTITVYGDELDSCIRTSLAGEEK